jgi:hypothetical protein
LVAWPARYLRREVLRAQAALNGRGSARGQLREARPQTQVRAANEKMAADSDADMEIPFDGERMFWGGSEPVVSEQTSSSPARPLSTQGQSPRRRR